MRTICIILLAAISFSGMAQDSPRFMNVLAVNGLNMRSKPAPDSRIVTKVAYGKRVEVIERTKVELKLGWITDNWYMVKYRGREGFVYGGYLSQLKPPAGTNPIRLSDLLPLYAMQSFTADGEPIETIEAIGGGDTLKHTLVRFVNEVELEIKQDADSHTSLLILSATVQDAYVLLEALLKQNSMKDELDNLRFVQSLNGQLSKVTNASGTISIKEYAEGLTAVRLKAYTNAN